MNEAIKAFSEKKATAKTMGVMWSIVSLLWLGMTIFCICIKQYGDLWATINLFLASSVLAVNNFAAISDAELAISAIECEQLRCSLMNEICKQCQKNNESSKIK